MAVSKLELALACACFSQKNTNTLFETMTVVMRRITGTWLVVSHTLLAFDHYCPHNSFRSFLVHITLSFLFLI